MLTSEEERHSQRSSTTVFPEQEQKRGTEADAQTQFRLD